MRITRVYEDGTYNQIYEKNDIVNLKYTNDTYRVLSEHFGVVWLDDVRENPYQASSISPAGKTLALVPAQIKAQQRKQIKFLLQGIYNEFN